MARPEWIEVGRVSRPHGVHGEVRIMPDSDNPERFTTGAILHARPSRLGVAGPRLSEQRRLTIDAVRGDAGFPIVAFREIGDRDAAEVLRGYVLEVRSTDLPALGEDEYYPFDLEGLRVCDPEGVPIGSVAEVIESPAHAILAVSLSVGREVLVPFVSSAVPLVAVAEGYLVVAPQFLDAGVDDGDRP
jgi:16S rRNA processing protein RimM